MDILKELIRHGGDIEYQSETGANLLVLAAISVNDQSTDVIDLLLKHGLSINSQEGEQTALIRAIHVGATKAALHLIKRGADIKRRDKGGRDALMYAVYANNLSVAGALLKAGAKIDIKDSYKETSMVVAKRNKNKAMVELLMKWSRKEEVD